MRDQRQHPGPEPQRRPRRGPPTAAVRRQRRRAHSPSSRRRRVTSASGTSAGASAATVANTRMQNLSAAVIRPQLPELARRVRDGRANHDHVAARLNGSPWLSVPPALPQETRAPDSIQFNLVGFGTDARARAFQEAARARGVAVQVFGLSENNARAFWNWQFLDDLPDLPQTRAMLMRACDLRLPPRLTGPELDFIADALIGAAAAVQSVRPRGLPGHSAGAMPGGC
ncbi:MAG: DegT/DnrJ/EryC1/StrS family aminotransferase [Defluviimonas sp.]|nr:DegT/DnrJ/EryC1/StrS family aminotransferase [Defluviimonas sp.]